MCPNWTKRGVGLVVLLVASTSASPASALLLENLDNGDELTVFYPYPSSYTYVDEGYAFDDDPLEAFVHPPYIMPVLVPERLPVRRSMVEPRMSFVDEMYRSTDAI